jgi:hypothetical protein
MQVNPPINIQYINGGVSQNLEKIENQNINVNIFNIKKQKETRKSKVKKEKRNLSVQKF